jgi:tRNA pseudouridine synthase 10
VAALKVRLEEALSGGLKEITKNPGCVDILFSVDCCGRCMLRFLGVRDFEIYELSSKEIKDILVKYLQTATTAKTERDVGTGSCMDQDVKEEEEEAICTACVGTVQYAEAIVDEIVERMQKEAYVTKTFNMNVTLPTSTLIRNHAMAIYWNQKLSSYPTAQVDIKEIFKLLISWPIERRTGLTLDFGVRRSPSIPCCPVPCDHILDKLEETRTNRTFSLSGSNRVNSECRWLSNMRRQRTIMFSFRR